MTEWQPIETAPKDGTIILVAIEHYDGPLLHDIVWWNDYYDYWESAGYDWKPVKYDEVKHIFHWMPLPPPPKKDGSNAFPTIVEFYDSLPETWDEAAKRGTITKDKFEEMTAKCFDDMLEERKEKK